MSQAAGVMPTITYVRGDAYAVNIDMTSFRVAVANPLLQYQMTFSRVRSGLGGGTSQVLATLTAVLVDDPTNLIAIIPFAASFDGLVPTDFVTETNGSICAPLFVELREILGPNRRLTAGGIWNIVEPVS